MIFGQGEIAMFFALLIASFRGLALFLAGSTVSYWLMQNAPVSEVLLSLGFALFVWLLAKGFHAIMGAAVPQLKFLNARQKRILAAVVCVAIGFVFSMGAM